MHTFEHKPRLFPSFDEDSQQPNDQGGIKFDTGKARWSLLPWKPLQEIVEVLTFGAIKYDDDNWQKIEPVRYKDAMLRHITAWLSGEKKDPETGKSHLAHAGCCLLFLMWFDERGDV